MIFLDYLYNLPNSTIGADNIFRELVIQVPAIIPLLLAFVFFIIFLGGIGRQNLKTGMADYPMWSVIASISTFLIALILSMFSGLINIDVLIIVVVLTIFTGVWFFLDRRNRLGEV